MVFLLAKKKKTTEREQENKSWLCDSRLCLQSVLVRCQPLKQFSSGPLSVYYSTIRNLQKDTPGVATCQHNYSATKRRCFCCLTYHRSLHSLNLFCSLWSSVRLGLRYSRETIFFKMQPRIPPARGLFFHQGSSVSFMRILYPAYFCLSLIHPNLFYWLTFQRSFIVNPIHQRLHCFQILVHVQISVEYDLWPPEIMSVVFNQELIFIF